MAGCCERLREDHRRTELQLAELSRLLDADDMSAFATLFQQVCDELVRHYVLEERALFPVLSMYRPMILMEVEHEDLTTADRAVRSAMTEGDAEKIASAFRFFDERLRAHIVEEDSGVFRMAETLPEPEEQRLIERKLAETADALATEPNLALIRPEPTLFIRKSPILQPSDRPIAMETLFEAEHDSVQLIRLKADQSLSPHWAAQYQCLLVLSGELTLTAGEQRHVLTAGDQVNIQPRLMFALAALQDASLLAFKVWPKPNYRRA